MGSLVKLFEGQNKVWTLGRSLTGFISRNQNSKVKEAKEQEIMRPPAPFLLFYQSKLPYLRQQHPTLSVTKLSKLASSMWKTESTSVQKQHRDEFDRRMELYRNSVKKVPRRPGAPFAQFLADKNSSLQYQYPNMSDRFKRASVMWKDLSVVEKQRYSSLFKNKLNEYHDNLSEEDRNLILEKSARKKEDILTNRPVRVRNSFSLFMKESAGQDTRGENRMKYLSQLWRNMPDTEKDVYKQKMEEHSKTYKRDLAKWQKERVSSRADTSRPTRVGNPFALFMKENAGKDTGGENRMIYFSQLWRNMPDTEKDVYKQKMKEYSETYKKDLEKWQKKHGSPQKK